MTVASHVPVGDPQVRFVSMQWPTKYRPVFDPHLYALVAAIRTARPDVGAAILIGRVDIHPDRVPGRPPWKAAALQASC